MTRDSKTGATASLAGAEGWPAWVPEAARNYLAHTEGGRTMRELAREAQVHPSTILRRVRRVESSRDDPLVDSALRQLSARAEEAAPEPASAIEAEAAPILRRLAEPGTVLAVARDMERGVVVRETDGEPQRLAVVDRALAEAMALQDWIMCDAPEARISRYRITPGGRLVLRRVPAPRRRGFAEAPAGFAGLDGEDMRLRHMRSLLPESPLSALARRRDREGTPFLQAEHVAAGERLREDWELAQREAGGALDWEALLREAAWDAAAAPSAPRPVASRERLLQALRGLGPGLAEVSLHCCCLLEGLEAFEARAGWAARSGKVVLRIALERLCHHYRSRAGRVGSMIG